MFGKPAFVIRDASPKTHRLAVAKAYQSRHVIFLVAFIASVLLSGNAAYTGTAIAVVWPSVGFAVWWGLSCRSRQELIFVSSVVFAASAIFLKFFGSDSPAVLFLGGVAAVAAGPAIALLTKTLDEVDIDKRTPTGLQKLSLMTQITRPRQIYHLLVSSLIMIVVSKSMLLVVLAIDGTKPTVSLFVALALRDLAWVLIIAGVGTEMFNARTRKVRRSEQRQLIAMVLLSIVVLVAIFIFGQGNPIVYLALLPLYWSATVLPVPLAALHALITSIVALLLGLGFGVGPFGVPPNSSFQVASAIHLFVIMCILLSLIVSTTVQRSRTLAKEFQTLTETIPDALLVVEKNGVTIPINTPAVEVVAETGEDAFLSRDVRSVDGTSLTKASRPAGRALGGESVSKILLEFEDIPAESKDRRIYAVSASPVIESKDDDPDYALLVWHDHTDEYLAMEGLRAANEEARLLFENAPQGIATLDRDGTIIQANAALAELLSIPEKDLLQKKIEVFCRYGNLSLEIDSALSVPGRIIRSDRSLVGNGGRVLDVALSLRTMSDEPKCRLPVLLNVVDMTERVKLQKMITQLADHDPLTGVKNRRILEKELVRMQDPESNEQAAGVVLLIDLDYFKSVNDILGHHVGDKTLIEFASLLESAVGSAGFVARLGGDEFVAVLPHVTMDEATTLAKRIVEAVHERYENRSDVLRKITASVGIASLSEARQKGVPPLELADRRLYSAKRAGRNRVIFAEMTKDIEKVELNSSTKSRVKEILDQESLFLVFQPILGTKSGRLALAEGLVRVQDSGDAISTMEFVSAIEAAGLAAQLDEWVIMNGIQSLPELQEKEPGFRISLNISGQSLSDKSLCSRIARELDRLHIQPGSLILEITETAPIPDMEAAHQFQNELRRKGVTWAVDDFGVGNEPFRYVKELEFDVVKIDGEFVQGAIRGGVDVGIMRSIMTLARELHLETIAEFVRDEKTFDLVLQEGVDYAQGEYVGTPMAKLQLIELLSQNDFRGMIRK